MLTSLPDGWSIAQLAALNELTELFEKFNLVKTIITATNDVSPESVKVRSDILALAQVKWGVVKTFPPAP